jgi:hypothetical protein
MYPVDFLVRLEDVRSRKKGFVNCIGATHYLLGLIDQEDYINPFRTTTDYMKLRFRKVTSNMGMPIMIPDEAVAFGFREDRWDDYWHMGIISPFDRTKVIQRPKSSMPIEETTFKQIFKNEKDTHTIRVDFLKLNPNWFYK